MIEIAVPGSKSYTNRALLLAALAKGKTVLKNALESDDTSYMIKALKELGVKIACTGKNKVIICGINGNFRKPQKTLFLGNAGTAVRFLSAVLATQNFESIITGDKRMKKRPIKDLVDALRQMGARIEYIEKNGFLPIKIKGPLTKSACTVKGNISSQFLSGLLMAYPLLKQKTEINVAGDLVSKPYINMTLDIMAKFGVSVENLSYRKFIIPNKAYKSCVYEIEGDASSASYVWGIAAIMREEIYVRNIPKNSKQADMQFLAVLEKMGCKIRKNNTGIIVKGPNSLKPLGKIDLRDMPDSAMTIAVLCTYANGISILKGLSNLRVKECDRLHALKTEFSKLGIKIIKLKDGLKIYGTSLLAARIGSRGFPIRAAKGRGASPRLSSSKLRRARGGTVGSPRINTYNDHRMAMCFGLLKLKIPRLTIGNPKCVNKTYPGFWNDLKNIKQQIFAERNLILTGMRGCGKSTIGKLLAKKMHRKFIDLDTLIEQSKKMKITNIVKKFDWKYFRNLEHKTVLKIAKEKNIVLATGGGTLMYAQNLSIIRKNGIIIYLQTKTSILRERLKKDYYRPSLTKKNFIDELEIIFKKRIKKYINNTDYIIKINDVSSKENFKQLLKIL